MDQLSFSAALLPEVEDLRRLLASRLSGSVYLYEKSVQKQEEGVYLLIRRDEQKKLIIITEGGEVPFAYEEALAHRTGQVLVCPLSPANAQQLRRLFPWTAPRPLGRATAIGCGDRLGLATPGHLRACRATGMRPVLAQQSIREMRRTGRTPQDVLDDVTWAVFQEGYTGGFGADADHLKTEEDVDRCFDAGYTMYTIDPSDYVDNEADHLEAEQLHERFAALPWGALDVSPETCLDRYVDEPFIAESEAGAVDIRFDAEALKRAAVKYGAAIAHTKTMFDHLAARYRETRPEEPYDLEMSVDETEHPTRLREHFFVAAELRRLGVQVTSLAPRFVGEFQKGIDFIGDEGAFEDAFEKHTAIAEALGGYKLSIHSGSDKFSVYPIIGRHALERVHLKTAGTSYLEALRIVARHAPGLFREVVRYAFERFEADTKTYHVTTDLKVVPPPAEVADDELEAVYLDENNGRQLLHITYGSVLSAQDGGRYRFRGRLLALLRAHEEEHYQTLQAHFLRHIQGLQAGRAAPAEGDRNTPSSLHR